MAAQIISYNVEDIAASFHMLAFGIDT